MIVSWISIEMMSPFFDHQNQRWNQGFSHQIHIWQACQEGKKIHTRVLLYGEGKIGSGLTAKIKENFAVANHISWWSDYRTLHTTQTHTNSQLPLSDHSVASCLTSSAEKLHWTHCFDVLPTSQLLARSALVQDAISKWCYRWTIALCMQLYFWSKWNLTISDKNSCILNMQWGITKQTQINSSWTDIAASPVPVTLLPNINREWWNRVHRKQSTHSIPPLPHTTLIC